MRKLLLGLITILAYWCLPALAASTTWGVGTYQPSTGWTSAIPFSPSAAGMFLQATGGTDAHAAQWAPVTQSYPDGVTLQSTGGMWNVNPNLGLTSLTAGSVFLSPQVTPPLPTDPGTAGQLVAGTDGYYYFFDGTAWHAFLAADGSAANLTGIFTNLYAALSGSNASDANQNTKVGGTSNSITGSGNTGVGYQSLTNGLTGNYNSALGFQAGYLWTSATNNVAVGCCTISQDQIGLRNTAIGSQALISLTGNGVSPTMDSDNIAVGYNAGSSLVTGEANIYIGNVGNTTESSTIRIGSVQNRTFISGISGVTVLSGAAPVFCTSGGQLAAWSTGALGLTVGTAGYAATAGTAAYATAAGNAATATTATACTGNAATVTNGVYTNGSYTNPAWLPSVSVAATATSLTVTLPVTSGGTGATTAATGLTNLGGLSASGGTLTGNLTVTGYSASGYLFAAMGSLAGSCTVDFNSYLSCRVVLASGANTLTLVAPTLTGTSLVTNKLLLVQPSGGAAGTVVWAGTTVDWGAGSSSLDTANNKISIVSLWYNTIDKAYMNATALGY